MLRLPRPLLKAGDYPWVEFLCSPFLVALRHTFSYSHNKLFFTLFLETWETPMLSVPSNFRPTSPVPMFDPMFYVSQRFPNTIKDPHGPYNDWLVLPVLKLWCKVCCIEIGITVNPGMIILYTIVSALHSMKSSKYNDLLAWKKLECLTLTGPATFFFPNENWFVNEYLKWKSVLTPSYMVLIIPGEIERSIITCVWKGRNNLRYQSSHFPVYASVRDRI